jgi:hypothetical protein
MENISKAGLGVVVRIGSGATSRVRFQVLFGPASLHQQRMGWPAPVEDAASTLEVADTTARPQADNWYGWRLMGANNRELGRSAMSFLSYPLARAAVTRLQDGCDRLVRHTLVDPASGRWSWRLDLDAVPVAISGRWYEREHDSRLGADTFVRLIADADLAHGMVTLRDRRGPGSARLGVDRAS